MRERGTARATVRAGACLALLVGVTLAAPLRAPLRAQSGGPRGTGAGTASPGVPGPGVHPPTAAMDERRRLFLLGDIVEYQPGASANPINVDALGWYGGDINRLWVRAEGDQSTANRSGEFRATVQYGHLVRPFFDAVAGLALDTRSTAGGNGIGPKRVTREMVAVGLQGLAPYWIEFEPTLYVSQKGDISARFTGSFDLLFTQRLMLQPRLEFNAAVQKVPEFGVGSGLNDAALGFRMRYEIRRQFAPYVGVSWQRLAGGTAAMARREGESVGPRTIVAGVRVWH